MPSDSSTVLLPSAVGEKLGRVMRYLAAEKQCTGSGDAWLFEILYFGFLKVPSIEVVALTDQLNRRRKRGEPVSFRQIILEKIHTPPKTLFEPPANEALVTAMNVLEQLLAEAAPITILRLEEALGAYFRTSTTPTANGSNELVSALVDKFVLSVSALNNYLRCPLKFYFETLLRAPAARSDAAEFGCAVHLALQQLFEKMQRDPLQQFPLKEEMLADFDGYMYRRQQACFLHDFSQRLAHGRYLLGKFYDKHIATWNKIVAVERNISNVVVSGVPVKGIIDKLEFDGRQVNIVDYKTGSLQYALEQLEPPNDGRPQGGNYWRQAVFYKLLVDHYPNKSWSVNGISFNFLEPDTLGEQRTIRVQVGAADIETVKRQIIDTWERIQAHDFYTGCGRPDCHWCGLAKEST